MQEEVRGWLAACHLGAAEDVRVQSVEQAHQGQGKAKALGGAAGGNAELAIERGQQLGNAADRLQAALEQRRETLPVPRGEIREGAAVARFEIGEHAGHADAGITLQDLLGGEIDDPLLGQAGEIGLDRQQLAVDQDAVAIEDDEIEIRHG